MVNTPKKPANQKGKSIYFNIDDPGELRLYQYAMSIKNFSGYMKAMLYSDLMKNNGHIPSPYNYATMINTDISLQETPLAVPAIPKTDFVSEPASHPTPEPIVEKGSFTPEPEEPDDELDDLEDDLEDEREEVDKVDESEEVQEIEEEGIDQDEDPENLEDQPPPRQSSRLRNTSSFMM